MDASSPVTGPPPRDPNVRARLVDLLRDAGADDDLDQLVQILASGVGLARDRTDRLNLKITNSALREMRAAFALFAPYRHVPKVTVFGSARTLPDDPLYRLACEVAGALADQGWMVVTGAGPGVMAAATEGAGRDRALGVNIKLPFEEVDPSLLRNDRKRVVMKYFFTRKLMLMKESAGFAVLPGGYGTLDEVFELLTLLQTGKATPAPLVLLDVPGGTYWSGLDRFLRDEVVEPGRAGLDDLALYRIVDDADDAAAEILGFYRNYHSIRYVGAHLVVRLRASPTDGELDALNREFADICRHGRIEATAPLPPEVADGDHVELARIRLHFDRSKQGRLRALVDMLNRLASAPAAAVPETSSAEAAAAPTDEDEET
ncbi:MAG: TIGR00730 family Rossman fold protein [Actinomycetota bacterium]|nr:TIGR00730 family Rossman fold protein [Actinomycetota bacterium]